MNQESTNITVRQATVLVLVVLALGLGGTYFLKRQTQTLSNLAESEGFPGSETDSATIVADAASKPSDMEPATPAASLVTEPRRQMVASVVLPRTSLSFDTKKLEEECQRFVERLLRKLPDDPLANNLAAIYYSRSKQTALANELWEKSVALDSTNELVFHNWATNVIHRGESERALEILDAAKQNGLESNDLLYQRSVVLSNLARDDEVVQMLQPLAKDGQLTAPLWLQLGLSQLKTQQFEEARSSLLEARAGGVENKTLINGLITASSRLRDRESAEKYREELEQVTDDGAGQGQSEYEARNETSVKLFVLGIIGEAIEIYRLAGELRDAEMAALRTLAIDPNRITACELLVSVYADQGNLANQMAVYERLIELQPGFLLHRLSLAKLAAENEEFQRAESLIKLTIAMDPNDSISFAVMGDFLIERDRANEAIWYIDRALELDPAPPGYLLLAKALRLAGKESEAVTAEQQARTAAGIPTVRASN